MKETILLRIALIASLIGIAVLFFVSKKIDLNDYKPDLENKNIGEDVKLMGTVTKITDRGNVVFIEVNEQDSVTVVLFGNDDLKLKRGDNVEVIGEVQEYKGKDEIIAQRIRILK